MKIVCSALILAAQMLFATVVVAECSSDAVLPDLPKGKKAAMEEMVAAQGAIKTYMASSNAYLECMDGEMTEIPEEEKDAKAAAVDAYNEAVDEQTELAKDFNKQLKAFKKANR